MAYAVSGPPSRSERRRPDRTAVDLGSGIVLLLVEAWVFVSTAFTHGARMWSAPASAQTDAATLASIAWTERVLVAVLVLAALAALVRASWTAVSQFLAAATLGVLLVLARHHYGLTHPAPAPVPTVQRAPCYSGSGACD